MDRCFSSTYYLLAGLASEIIGNVARVMIKVQTPDHQQLLVKANPDTGGSRNLASSHVLQNMKRAEEYGGKPICMVTIQGPSSAYTHQGELHFFDENEVPIILLCYVQEIPIPGHDDFVLISNNTLVDINSDINFHAKASKEIGVLPLRRTVNDAFHYKDEVDPHSNSKKTAFLSKDRQAPAPKERHPSHNDGCQYQPDTFPNLTEVGICHITGRKTMASRKGRSNPKKDKKHKVAMYYCYLSEIELQGLLDRTNLLHNDEEAMDMVVLIRWCPR